MEKQTKQKNKWISFLADGMLSGIMIGIGGVVSLSSDNRYIGALLFSLGLFCIVQFQYGLYTGKVGYIVNREPAFIAETLVTLVGNTLGAAVAALLIRLTRFASDTNVVNLDVTIVERAQTTVDAKLSDHPLSAFILAVFCGLLMFSAVESNRICSKKGNYPAALFGVVMPIQSLYCGFVLLFFGRLSVRCQGGSLYSGCNFRKCSWRYVDSAAEKVFQSAALNQKKFRSKERNFS